VTDLDWSDREDRKSYKRTQLQTPSVILEEFGPKIDQGTMSKNTNAEIISSDSDQLAECHGDLLPDLDHSMWDMFHSTALKYPSRDAVVSLWQPNTHLNNLLGRKKLPDIETEELTETESVFRWNYEELLRAVELLAGWLQSQGCAEDKNLVSLSKKISFSETRFSLCNFPST
jgi:hypothetical protein